MTREEVAQIYHGKLFELVYQAQTIHRENFEPNQVQLSSLLSIKTGGCPENCSYCPQSAHYETGVKKHRLMSTAEVRTAALEAQNNGATRFCMGAAWREVKDGPEFDNVVELVREVKSLGLEVCCTLGMLNETQAARLKEAGLYAYNHNIDSSRAFYSKVISTGCVSCIPANHNYRRNCFKIFSKFGGLPGGLHRSLPDSHSTEGKI